MLQCHVARASAGVCVCCVVLALPAMALAAEKGGGIEEVIVTAQRTAESIQDVPIAVTALTGDMLDDKQVITVSDLQMNAPNVSFTPTNFGSNSFSIRGIGRLVTSTTGDAGVSIHTNEIAIGPNLNSTEFYDLERVEVLRGPQGTLYGKSATGGAVNLVTKMPDFDGVGGFIDLEGADYSNTRVKAALNIPITDNFALRFAGMKLDRDGYTKNLAHGQVGVDGRVLDGIKKDLDGRDILDFRITAAWQITDRADAWVLYNRFDEDDDRARITNQICVRNTEVPTYGCLPDKVGFEQPNETTNFFNIGPMLFGLMPLGAPLLDAAHGGQGYNWPRPQLGLRKQHTDFQPIYEETGDSIMGGISYEFDNFAVGLVGGYTEGDYDSRQDYWMDVGAEIAPNFYTGSPFYPISAPAGGPGADAKSGPCNFFDGTSGNFGGCTLRDDLTRVYSYDVADSRWQYWTVEGKVQSTFEGRFNFLLGGIVSDWESNGDYYVFGNGGDARPDVPYPGFFDNTSDPGGGTLIDSWAVFGETYFDITDKVKLTMGLRYNDDQKKVNDTSVLWNATDANFGPCLVLFADPASYDPTACSAPGFGGTAPVLLTRIPGFVNGAAPTASEQALIDLYGQTSAAAAAAATGRQSAQRLAINAAVPPAPTFGETRVLTGSPDSFSWEEFSGRIGIDWAINDDSMMYFFYSRGYKPGGANPAIPPQFQGESSFDFAKESVDAFEIGTKNTLLDGRLVLNGAAFMYQYDGLQIARIKNNTALNENIDADILGAELEMMWRPAAIENLEIDFAYSYLDTEVKGNKSVDPLNREGGDPDFITLNQIGFLYAARRSDINQATIDTVVEAGAGFPAPNAVYVNEPGLPPNTPVIMVRGALAAACLLPNAPLHPGTNCVETLEGVPVDLDGNELPNAPKHTIHLGLGYTWNIPAIAGSLTARYDYYWQDKSYSREFNTVADRIDSWDQHNASLIYESENGHWSGRMWIRNIADDDNITGHYVTSDTSGYYRNYFLTEPRIYGASVRYNFGT